MKRRRGTDAILLIVLCAIGAMLGRMQSQARDAGRLDVFSSIASRMVLPVSSGLGKGLDATGDFFAGIVRGPALRAEVRRLRAQQAQLSQYTEHVDVLEKEIDDLRRLNDLGRRPGQTRIPADVIGYTPRENRLTVSAGSAEGVAAGLAVVCPDGLLGIVSTVAPHTSQVSMLGTANLIIGAMVGRTPPSAGLLQGAGVNSLYIDLNDPKAEVKAGDLVLTSGYSEKIPRGIIIGRVLSVDDIPELGQRRANVFPATNLGSNREVVILK